MGEKRTIVNYLVFSFLKNANEWKSSENWTSQNVLAHITTQINRQFNEHSFQVDVLLHKNLKIQNSKSVIPKGKILKNFKQ